nr:immunoglobulin heavy chain junction region [Mus musculus]MBK4188645.1 immunoglobulin heavy chain junction region [Mus musculus]MBK4188648.1 immunoglobulin heavy chain junction region [Mus musculus]MBK4188649.1 immunoglobulin heavy chain junction region [Mus musculus]
CVRVIPFDYW